MISKRRENESIRLLSCGDDQKSDNQRQYLWYTQNIFTLGKRKKMYLISVKRKIVNFSLRIPAV